MGMGFVAAGEFLSRARKEIEVGLSKEGEDRMKNENENNGVANAPLTWGKLERVYHAFSFQFKIVSCPV